MENSTWHRCSSRMRPWPSGTASAKSSMPRAREATVYTTFLATRGSIERNRAAFSAMIRAVRRTQSWLYDHSAEELADVVAAFYPHVARELLADSLRRYREAGLWARRPEVSREGFARLAECLLSGGFIARTHAYEDCVDQSLY